MEKRFLRMVLGASMVFLALSCDKNEPRWTTGDAVTFTAATSWQNGDPTRTEYSGELVSDRKYERINWVVGEDRIRILCAQAYEATSQDYDIVSATNKKGDKDSEAGISPVSSPLRWGSEKQEHIFFALYPAPGMQSKIGGEVTNDEASITLADDGNSATVTGVIPSEQKGQWSGREFKPDMNHAYMGAAVKAKKGSTVELPFSPLVTAIEFNLLAVTEEIAAAKLTSLQLSSASTELAGSFSTVLQSDNSHSAPVITDGEKSVMLNLGEGINLSTSSEADEYAKITVLALPVDETDMTLTLGFKNTDGSTFNRSLLLNQNDEPVTVHACKKVYIRNLGVNTLVYTLKVGSSLEDMAAEGATGPYEIMSYKADASGRSEVAWKATFSTDGKNFSDEMPSWLSVFTSKGAGSTDDYTEYSATLDANPALPVKGWQGTTTVGTNSSKASAIDLSTVDINGNTLSAGQSTANCYVIGAPGWYKFPAVYGNAIKNGGTNADSYDGDCFVNALGNKITNPSIPDDTDISELEAVLCWQDVQGLATDIEYSDNYLYFQIPEETIQQGNAVIALRSKADATILWSWHIWTMEAEGSNGSTNLGTTALYSHPDRSSAVEPNYLLNVNLGWCDADEYVGTTRSVIVKVTQEESGINKTFVISQKAPESYSISDNATYYQWGRKDPMLGASGSKGTSGEFTDKEQYYSEEDLKWSISIIKTGVQVKEGLLNPNIFYQIKSGWLLEGDSDYTSMWDSKLEDCNADQAVTKTVYDPSPVGFTVPNFYAFTVFNTDGPIEEGKDKGKDKDGLEYFNSPSVDVETDRGFYFYNKPNKEGELIYVAALGYRKYQTEISGNLSNVGSKSYYWLSGPTGKNGHDAHRLYIGDVRCNPTSDWYTSLGFPMRPVKEQ